MYSVKIFTSHPQKIEELETQINSWLDLTGVEPKLVTHTRSNIEITVMIFYKTPAERPVKYGGD